MALWRYGTLSTVALWRYGVMGLPDPLRYSVMAPDHRWSITPHGDDVFLVHVQHVASLFRLWTIMDMVMDIRLRHAAPYPYLSIYPSVYLSTC